MLYTPPDPRLQNLGWAEKGDPSTNEAADSLTTGKCMQHRCKQLPEYWHTVMLMTNVAIYSAWHIVPLLQCMPNWVAGQMS